MPLWDNDVEEYRDFEIYIRDHSLFETTLCSTKMRVAYSWISSTVVSLLQLNLASDILMALAIKCINNLPPHLTLVMFLHYLALYKSWIAALTTWSRGLLTLGTIGLASIRQEEAIASSCFWGHWNECVALAFVIGERERFCLWTSSIHVAEVAWLYICFS